MAKNNNVVLLGYEDELITEKHRSQVDFTVNKIGGEPDFPHTICKIEKLLLCVLCKLPTRQIVQIYAPLENTKDHRTLYLFACINPTCHNKSESWTCLRVQAKYIEVTEPKESVAIAPKLSSTTDWCSEADNWGDDDDDNGNFDAENCNVISNSTDNNKPSDDEESSSFDDSVRSGFRNLSIDKKNANNGAQGGAVARQHSPMATAEIEGEEDGEVVTVESPTTPQTNLVALLQGGQTNIDNVPLQAPFVASFLSVYPEERDTLVAPAMDNHVKELLTDYQRKDADFLLSHNNDSKSQGKSGDVEMAAEEYEKSHPLHGDKIFHHFLTKIKSNPEQVLRYCREGSPLLLYPLQEPLKKCKHCQKELVFEFQLISTIIPQLRLECDANHSNRLDFGTVLVYTCKNSCWGTNDVFKEEVVVVQKETF